MNDSLKDSTKWLADFQEKTNPLKDFIDIIDNSNSPLIKAANFSLLQTSLPFANTHEAATSVIAPFMAAINSPLLQISLPIASLDFGCNIFDSPLYRYAQEMQSIINKYSFVDLSYYTDLVEVANEFIEAKDQAENNYYHNIVVKELEAEVEQTKQHNIELEQKVKEYESAFATTFKLIQAQAPAPTYRKHKTLNTNILPTQIAKLHSSMKGVFDATIDQWRALFSDTKIQLSEPIKAQAPADIAILLHHLKASSLIETSKYPSTIEQTKAFSIKGKAVTAKQINKVKSENPNFPFIGRHYVAIQSIIENL